MTADNGWLTFDLAFHWAKARSNPELSQKVKWFRSAKDVKLNFGLSLDFSIQLTVSVSERLSQKLKSPNENLLLLVTVMGQ